MAAPDPSQLKLYQFYTCPYCQRVRSVIEDLELNIEMRDTLQDPTNREELINGGGRSMVPCLRIEHDDGDVEWMYESADIIRYLKQNYG